MSKARSVFGWLTAHTVDVAFALLAAGWVVYALRISGGFYFWADDLRMIEQAGTWHGLIEPYNNHMTVVALSIYRVAAEVSNLSYTPFMVAGVASLFAVPASFYITTRRRLGPPLAAILATTLLWFDGMGLAPSALNHFLALAGGIVCAGALDRGRRADGVLAAALAFSLCSAGGGVVVAGACLVHNVLVRPARRRWLAVLVPSGCWVVWWLVLGRTEPSAVGEPLTAGDTVLVVRDLCLAPFYQVGFGLWPVAAALLAAFLAHGAAQLRRGPAAGANFVAWSAALVALPLVVVQTRGSDVDPQTFRYAYLSLGLALLAVVPRHAISWPKNGPALDRRWAGVAAVIVLALGGARFLHIRSGLQDFASTQAQIGREAKGTVLVLGLGPDVIPDSKPIRFFGFGDEAHGTAERTRRLLHRYGSPFHATISTVDQELVDLHVARAPLEGPRDHDGCPPLVAPLRYRGTANLRLGEPPPAERSTPEPLPLRLWSAQSFRIELRRYGDNWVRLADVPAGFEVMLSLPRLDSDTPWQIRADGACDVT